MVRMSYRKDKDSSINCYIFKRLCGKCREERLGGGGEGKGICRYICLIFIVSFLINIFLKYFFVK